MRGKGVRVLGLSLGILFMGLIAQAMAGDRGENLWASGGHDVRNSRHASQESILNADNVAKLTPKWVFTAQGDVVTTPAVDETAVYFPDSAGGLHKVSRETGVAIWSRTIASYTGSVADGRGPPSSRNTPIVSGNTLILGTRDAFILAINKVTGDLLWKTKVDPHPAATITMSAVLDKLSGRVYVGVSSTEEQFAALVPNYVCCTFRGSALALDVHTGKILWRTYSVPQDYTGGALIGGTPVIDHKRRSVYFTTGNNYSVPVKVAACAATAGNDRRALRNCTSPRDYFDSVLALDSRTGSIKWAKKLEVYDTWTLVCLTPGVCPPPESPDYDFASGPNLFTTVASPGKPARDLVGAGQKNGVYWALNPDDGRLVWATQVGPGGFLGGIQWGSATDGKRVYVALGNSNATAYKMKSGETITWGFYSAIDAATGHILWQTADPTPQAQPMGFVSLANGVMFAGSADPAGHYYALDAKTGSILWRFASGGTVVSGAAIVNGNVYWGSGYGAFGVANDKLYAFELP